MSHNAGPREKEREREPLSLARIIKRGKTEREAGCPFVGQGLIAVSSSIKIDLDSSNRNVPIFAISFEERKSDSACIFFDDYLFDSLLLIISG